MATTTQGQETAAGYRAAFNRLEAGRREPAWLQAARRSAMEAFEARGIPTPRDEDWRFTNVSALAGRAFPPIGTPDVAAAADAARRAILPATDGPVLVFVDGHFAPGLSRVGDLPSGVRLGSLARYLPDADDWLEDVLARDLGLADRPFAALNTALFEDGAYLFVPPGVVLEQPVQFVFAASGSHSGKSVQARALIHAGANSQLRLVETFTGRAGARSFTNAVTEIVAAESAVVDHYRLQREADTSYHIGQTRIEIGRSASVSSHAVATGGLLARHDAVAVLAGPGADCTLNGLYLADGAQLVDNHTEIDHAMPNGTSHEIYKGILGGHAKAVFNGRIRVRPDAQKTDAKQTNKTLLLSDEAQINTKPQLEIFANDVKCTHGATVGQLSADALFYLRSRGIGAEDARSLLIRAFAMDIISRIRLEPVRAELDRLLASRLPGGLAQGAFV